MKRIYSKDSFILLLMGFAVAMGGYYIFTVGRVPLGVFIFIMGALVSFMAAAKISRECGIYKQER